MKRTFNLQSPLAIWGIAGLIILAVIPRIVALELKPLMHDESLFAYYSYNTMVNGQYSHIPMLHGPTLMLATGALFKVFGDHIGVARMFVAVISLVGMLAGVALWPRRYRLWMAPLLLTSPILLFYSRFFRDDMIVATTYLLATLGVAYWSRPAASRFKPLWAAVGGFFIVVPLAIMESALFFQAAGVTFVLVWAANRLLWRGRSASLRLPRRAPVRSFEISPTPPLPDKAGRRRNRKEIQQEKTFAAVVMPLTREERQAEAESLAAARRALLGRPSQVCNLKTAAGWVLGAAAGLGFVLLVYGITFVPAEHPEFTMSTNKLVAKLEAPLFNMRASWDYWKDQHMQHRIEGPLHYHLPILATYELPLLLLIGAGLIWDATRRARRAIFYGVATWIWLWIWVLWRAISHDRLWDFDLLKNPYAPPLWLEGISKFLHISPDLSMLVLGLLITPLLAWSILMLREHRVLGAWMGWWAACSLFQYSSAGEKVPWLALHIALPLYMAAGWLWAPWLLRMSANGRRVALGVMLAAVLLAGRADLRFFDYNKSGGRLGADPHERLVFNHTPAEYDRLCRDHLSEWINHQEKIPLAKRNVWLVDAPGWPGVWYFRKCAYHLVPTAPETFPPDADLIIGNDNLMKPLLDHLGSIACKRTDLSLRDHWLAPWPEQHPLRSWWRYYWYRETWDPQPGTFPVIALEPVKPRGQ